MEIRGGDVAALVRESWEAHHGVMCVGVNCERHSRLPVPYLPIIISLDCVLVPYAPQRSRICEVGNLCADSSGLHEGETDNDWIAGLEELVVIADCIGAHAVASICRLLAEDHAGWSGRPVRQPQADASHREL